MLVLARKLNQNIIIDGRIVVKVLRVERDTVKLGIQAPANIPVHRQEVYEEIQRSNRTAVQGRRGPVPRLTESGSDTTQTPREPDDQVSKPPTGPV
jgi:carbon storage regulator